MKNILEEIIEVKKKEVSVLKSSGNMERFQNEGPFWKDERRSLMKQLVNGKNSGIIAEFKRKSPSKGWFKNADFEVVKVAEDFNSYAAAISILTDGKFFGGSLDDLIKARSVTTVPLLRKDFIIDKWQIAEAKAFGADVILLIAACLTKEEVKDLSSFGKELGIEVILELHDETELEHICISTEIIGINNRNLKTFEVDIERSLKMAEKIPGDKIKIAESGISSTSIINLFRRNGFKGFLIGEEFMKQENPGKAFKKFVTQLYNE